VAAEISLQRGAGGDVEGAVLLPRALGEGGRVADGLDAAAVRGRVGRHGIGHRLVEELLHLRVGDLAAGDGGAGHARRQPEEVGRLVLGVVRPVAAVVLPGAVAPGDVLVGGGGGVAVALAAQVAVGGGAGLADVVDFRLDGVELHRLRVEGVGGGRRAAVGD